MCYKDYANPLTRFAMRDYPQDGGAGMSQVHHGSKMLLDLPSEMASPAVRVDGHIYFTNELLQCKDHSLFIPERFFYDTPKVRANEDGEDVLLSLGRKVYMSDVSYSDLALNLL